MSSIATTTGTTRGDHASPKPSTTQQRVDEVLRRKAEAERRVAERREALKQEQMHKLEKINAFREQERRERSRKNAEKELMRQKEALDRRQAQLEENQKKKEAILAKAHAATSRTANKENNKKSFAFGSSTPRELAYLQTLSKEAKVYDKKLRPEPLSPSRLRPAAGAAGGSTLTTPNAMTTSVYVYSPPREVRPSPRVVSRIRSTVTSSAPTNHGGIGGAMTQSMHVSSTSSSAFPHSQPRPALPTRAARPPTGPTPTRPPRAAAPAAATERKREPVARRTAAAAASPAPSPAGRSLRGARGGMTNTAPVAPSPLTVATNQEVSSSVSSLPVDNTPPAPPSEDSDAGFSEGSYERAGSEKSTPVHGGVEQTIEEEITPRDEHPAMAIAAEAVEEKVAAPAAAAVVEEEAAAAAAPLVSPPTSLHAAEVVELDYSSPLIDVAQTPVVEATLVEEEKKKEEQSELPEETKQDTVANEVKEEYLIVPEAVPAVEEPSVPQEPIVTEPTVATETPAVPEDTVAEEITVPQEITVAHPEERNLLVDFSQASEQEEKREEEEDRTPLVEEVTPIGERAMSLADELGGLFGGGKMEDEKKEEQSLIQIEKVVFDVGKKEEKVEESLNQIDQVVSDGEKKENKIEESLIQIEQTASYPVPPLSHIEDTVVNSLADELQQALGVVEKKEEEQRREPVPPSSSSPTPHEESGRLSAHPSTSSLPSGSSSGTESGESSPNTRRRRTEEKKAEMMKQSTILAMADSAAKERDERKARLAAIMNRTRAGGASTPSSSTMTTSMSASMIGSTTGGEPTSSSSASSVLAKIAHITSNPRIMQVAEKTGSSSDLRMGELPGAVPQY